MSAIFYPIFEFFARNKWAQIALIVVVAVLSLGMYVHGREEKAKREQKRLNDLANARERARMVETSTAIKEIVRHDREKAIAAGDNLPPVSSVEQLRRDAPAISEVLIRRGD